MKITKSHFMVLFFGLFLGLVICECSLCILGFPRTGQLYYRFVNPELKHKGFIFDKDLFWCGKPRACAYGVQLNNKGFRGLDFCEQKPDDVIRMICLGDSCMFQAEVDDGETTAFLLQRKLTAEFPQNKFQVYNMGIPGYTSFQGRRLLEMKALKYQPDILLVSFGHNDCYRAFVFSDKQQYASFIKYRLDSILSRMYTYRLLRDAYRKKIYCSQNTFNEMLCRVSLDDFADNIRAICSVAKQCGCVPVFYDLPSLNRGDCWFQFKNKYFDRLAEVVREEDVLFVDTRTFFYKHADMKALFNDPENDAIHFNADGYRLLAELLYPSVEECVREIVTLDNE